MKKNLFFSNVLCSTESGSPASQTNCLQLLQSVRMSPTSLLSPAHLHTHTPGITANHTSPEPSLCRGICIEFQVILQLLNTRGHIAHKLEDMCYIERQLHKRGAGLATKMMVDQEGHSLDFFVSAIHEQNHVIAE